MERVAFLVESTGERLGCLLNPDTLVVRRLGGVRARGGAGGHLTGAGLADDPLLFTGGGRTELDLELLFDVNLAGAGIATDDVRQLTAPLWALAENGEGREAYGRPPQVRFVWGKSWNVPGIVGAVAERLEQFSPAGTAQRSWMSLRMIRVGQPPGPPPVEPAPLPPEVPPPLPEGAPLAPGTVLHQVLGTGGDPGSPGSSESLYQLAQRYYGNPGLWRLIAAYNGIADPLQVPAGAVLRIPPQPGLGGAA
jgi:hypothetical protein